MKMKVEPIKIDGLWWWHCLKGNVLQKEMLSVWLSEERCWSQFEKRRLGKGETEGRSQQLETEETNNSKAKKSEHISLKRL